MCRRRLLCQQLPQTFVGLDVESATSTQISLLGRTVACISWSVQPGDANMKKGVQVLYMAITMLNEQELAVSTSIAGVRAGSATKSWQWIHIWPPPLSRALKWQEHRGFFKFSTLRQHLESRLTPSIEKEMISPEIYRNRSQFSKVQI